MKKKIQRKREKKKAKPSNGHVMAFQKIQAIQKRTDRQIDRPMRGPSEQQTNCGKNLQTNREMDWQLNQEMGQQTNKEMDRQSYSWMNRQTIREM